MTQALDLKTECSVTVLVTLVQVQVATIALTDH